MESLYDYGSRAGFWRLHRLFTKKKIPATVFAVGMALERNPAVCHALKETDWEVASHGYRWIDYQKIDPETEKEHIARTIKIHEKLLGKRPVGFYQGKVCDCPILLCACCCRGSWLCLHVLHIGILLSLFIFG
jgi:allantoinase